MAALFAALALAICSRRAADDFLGVWTGASSIESTVIAVAALEVVEALDRSRPSFDVVEDFAEARDTFLTGLIVMSESSAEFIADRDGFLNSPFTDARGLSGRAATVLEPYFGNVVCAGFSGLGERFAFDGVPARGNLEEAERGVKPKLVFEVELFGG